MNTLNLCDAEISLDEIIEFRWNNKILEQIINLQLMMVLQQNFKKVLLNWAPSSIHLHPALCNTLKVIRTKISHIIWQFFKSWAKKLKVVNIYRKLTQMVFWWCLFQIWTYMFEILTPKSNIWGNSALKILSCLFLPKIGTHGIWRMLILILILVFWISKPKSIFGQTLAQGVELSFLSDVVTYRILSVMICLYKISNWRR